MVYWSEFRRFHWLCLSGIGQRMVSYEGLGKGSILGGAEGPGGRRRTFDRVHRGRGVGSYGAGGAFAVMVSDRIP